VSIGRRFVDLVRANLNALFDRGEDKPLDKLSEEELEEELRRRRSRKEAPRPSGRPDDEAAAWEEVERSVREGSSRYRSTRRPSPGESPRRPAAPSPRDAKVAQLYAQLECPPGADLEAVRKQYRALMRKYHPDMHSQNPDKQRLATELSQRLTMAYNELRRILEQQK